MILRRDQVPALLEAAEAISGHRLDRLRRRLGEDDSDANQLELVSIMAALSVCDVEPEHDECGPQPSSSPDVRCTLPSGKQFLIESRHTGADLSPDDFLRPPRHVGFAARAEEEIERAGVRDGKRVRLQFVTETGAAPRFPPRQTWQALFNGVGFQAFAQQLKEDGKALWKVEGHGFFVRAVGFNSFERSSQLPPDFREHPVYKGLKRKMQQVAELAAPHSPVVLLLGLSDCVPLTRSPAVRSNWDSVQVCRAAFGMPGVGELLVGPEGLRTHGRIQGIENVAAAMVLEVSPANYWPRHLEMHLIENQGAVHPLPPEVRAAIASMVYITHHAPHLDATTLCNMVRMRREALAWNEKPEDQRRAEFMASVAAREAGTEATGELVSLLRRGHRIGASSALLSVWPGTRGLM